MALFMYLAKSKYGTVRAAESRHYAFSELDGEIVSKGEIFPFVSVRSQYEARG